MTFESVSWPCQRFGIRGLASGDEEPDEGNGNQEGVREPPHDATEDKGNAIYPDAMAENVGPFCDAEVPVMGPRDSSCDEEAEVEDEEDDGERGLEQRRR